MTDNNIIEMSERCIRGNECDKCLYYELGRPDCMLELIKRQKEEIEKLKENQDTLTTTLARSLAVKMSGGNPIAEIKAEAIKEFAERLKKCKCSYTIFNYPTFDAIEIEDIDNLVKEMISDNNE